LVLPSFILGFGVLTRFDIVTAGESFRNLPWLQSVLIARMTDTASTLLDWVNLICFAISFWVLLEVARPSVEKTSRLVGDSARQSFSAWFVFVPLGILSLLAFLFKWDRSLLWKSVYPQATILILFLILLGRCFLVAIRRHSITGVIMSALSLLLIFWLAT
jgi:hypothetical protein